MPRGIFIVFVSFLLFFCRAAMASDSPAAQRPNIITIAGDDIGWNDVGFHGSSIKTPNIDKLAAAGARLDRFYVNPICSLTRASFLTGQFCPRTGVNNRSGLPLDYRIFPEDFRAAGYQTWMCGKWHLGGSDDNMLIGREYHPDSRGFDHFYGFLAGAVDYFAHVNPANGKPDWWRNGQAVVEKGYSTELLADEAISLIKKRDPDKPFLLHLAFNAAHGPLQPPATVAGRGGAYHAVVEAMDRAIGRVLDTLDEQKIADSTIVLFFCDNGAQEGRGGSNAPLRGFKGEAYEGGVRSAAALRYPPAIRAGSEFAGWMWAGDVWPTLAAAAGIKPQPAKAFDGVNMWPALIAADGMAARAPFAVGSKSMAWFEPPWKLIVSPDGPAELYNLADDPGETRNLAMQDAERVTRMTSDLKKNLGSWRMKGAGGKGGRGQGGEGGRGRRHAPQEGAAPGAALDRPSADE
ncbi:MAG: arylsulfatase [Chthoniobacterales bacterium]|nr:arylsulfatase [Chthoniobacterales bacterium]